MALVPSDPMLIQTTDPDTTRHINTERFVTLKRVSTQKQGADGLGIAAQERDIQQFLQQHPNAVVIEELVEVGSGGKEVKDRPVLLRALELCRQNKAILLVSVLSRLTRDAAICLNLMKDTSIEFKVASMPSANNLQLGIYAVLNEEERRQVSRRTTAALAAAKARGVKLGNPRLAEMNSTRKREARNYACEHAPLIQTLRNQGKTHREICEVLNASGMSTRSGKQFYPVHITRILRRAVPSAEVA